MTDREVGETMIWRAPYRSEDFCKQMSTLLFMPWCQVDKTYTVGDVTIMPFHRYEPIVGLDDATLCKANAAVAIYKDLNGKPVSKAALAYYTGKSPAEELDVAQSAIARELVALACFSGLAKREYFGSSDSYWNSDCFTLYVQNFSGRGFTALETRRREGSMLCEWTIDDVSITIPTHCHPFQTVSLDENLLTALANQRAALLPQDKWGSWQNVIQCFNWANTDNSNIYYQIEWVLLCSAFEQFLAADSKAKDVACKFAKTFVPSSELMATNSNRLTTQQKNNGQSLRYEWMGEFYRVRGDFAHGNLATRQPMTWEPLEHLVLAAIAFPLLVKSVLSKDSKYTLTDNDYAQIDAFEAFADTRDCLERPTDSRDSIDSHWKRLVRSPKGN